MSRGGPPELLKFKDTNAGVSMDVQFQGTALRAFYVDNSVCKRPERDLNDYGLYTNSTTSYIIKPPQVDNRSI